MAVPNLRMLLQGGNGAAINTAIVTGYASGLVSGITAGFSNDHLFFTK